MKIKELTELINLIKPTVKELIVKINRDELSFYEAEKKVLEFVNCIGSLMTNEIVENVEEPILENRILVDEEPAVFNQQRNLRFINRFGGLTIKSRRTYQYLHKSGQYSPLDEKLGLDLCKGFSPLLSYLQSLAGSEDAFGKAAGNLSEALGFKVSATAVQNNTEAVGQRIPEHPFQMISDQKMNETSDLMVVEIDGTMSPQIHEQEGVEGRESLKQPTEYKECNLIVVKKYLGDQEIDHFVGGRYGPRSEFEEYVRQVGLKMGQLKAQKMVFIADGAPSNWEIQLTNFSRATQILDFYHATEHLGGFCGLYKNEDKGKLAYRRWCKMLLEGEVLQVIDEMKRSMVLLSNEEAGQKQINYFENNKGRMKYDEYRNKGYPIGSGMVEGSCKFVVGKRFKGSGMRWKKKDNKRVLKVRLANINGILQQFFLPNPQTWSIAA